MIKLVIGYFYPKLLNLYGDNGNVEIMRKRAERRGIDVVVRDITLNTNMDSEEMKDINFIFMGGGPDSSQKEMYEDLIKNKGSFLKKYIASGGCGLYICGAYQLLGNYYKSADGSVLDGLGVFDMYTQHFGNHKSRCIGNIVCGISEGLLADETFDEVNTLGDTLVGFENHGGRTYLGNEVSPLGRVQKGHGNNGEDSTEGLIYKNSIGTYLHGPVLSKNPHLADYLLAKSLKIENLEELDDTLIVHAHTASKNLDQ